MGEIIKGDDGLPAEDVGRQSIEKIDYLCSYVDISRYARSKFLSPIGRGGATYIDLFCSTGRSRVRDTGEWIDGSPVAAWRKSVEGGAPFTKVIVGDIDKVRLDACVARLEQAGAPVEGILGPASETAFKAIQKAPYHSLKLAFLDPFNLRSLDFEIIRQLARTKRVDLLVHVSKMDLQRNLGVYLSEDASAFDSFAPGWREHVSVEQAPSKVRSDLFEYWRKLVSQTGIATSDDTKLITGNRGQHLYWLLIAASHELAHRFWKACTADEQGRLDF